MDEKYVAITDEIARLRGAFFEAIPAAYEDHRFPEMMGSPWSVLQYVREYFEAATALSPAPPWDSPTPDEVERRKEAWAEGERMANENMKQFVPPRPAPPATEPLGTDNDHLSTIYKLITEYWAIVGPDEHYLAAKHAVFALADERSKRPATEPDWSVAVSTQDYHIFAADGRGWFCNERPILDDGDWRASWQSHWKQSGLTLPLGIDYRTTLTQRPAAPREEVGGGN